MDGETGRVIVFREMKERNPKDSSINSLTHKNQSAIFQLRTGHYKFNFSLNRFHSGHPPHCRSCTHPYETTEHVLFECLGLKTENNICHPHQQLATTSMVLDPNQKILLSFTLSHCLQRVNHLEVFVTNHHHLIFDCYIYIYNVPDKHNVINTTPMSKRNASTVLGEISSMLHFHYFQIGTGKKLHFF